MQFFCYLYLHIFLHISRTSVDGDCTSSLALAILRTVDCKKFSSKVIYFSYNLLNFWVDWLDQWESMVAITCCFQVETGKDIKQNLIIYLIFKTIMTIS